VLLDFPSYEIKLQLGTSKAVLMTHTKFVADF